MGIGAIETTPKCQYIWKLIGFHAFKGKFYTGKGGNWAKSFFQFFSLLRGNVILCIDVFAYILIDFHAFLTRFLWKFGGPLQNINIYFEIYIFEILN